MNDTTNPLVSIIIPARNCAAHLRQALASLRDSTFEDYEILVVDDHSSDETAEVAESLGAKVLRLERQSGPAAARNHGAERAVGETLVFLDADVCTHGETLERIVETFRACPDVDAMFGSYDSEPSALNIISQYKNLFHHFVHQQGRESSSTFWAGCGAVRREVFVNVGGFNATYTRPCVEDIELGVRLRKAGYQVVLNKDVQVKHLKRWSLWSMLKSDVLDRALPWTRLILAEQSLPNDLNLHVSQRISAVLAFGLAAIFLSGVWQVSVLALLPVLGVAMMIGLDRWSETRRVPTPVRLLTVLSVAALAVAIGLQFQLWALAALALMLSILLLNRRYYAFLARERHTLFAAVAFTLHLLYYLYSGMAFGFALCAHHLSRVPHLLARSSERIRRRVRYG